MQSVENSRIQAIDRILNAKSVAVVGASKNITKWGYRIIDTIIKAGYQGQVYPINPRETEIHGLKVYKNVLDVPGQLDTIMIAIPNRFIPQVIKEGVQKEAGGAVIVANGYREVGNPEKEAELLALIKDTDFHLVGPNIQGIGYIPNCLCAQTQPIITKQGPLGVITQSGSVTATLAEWAQLDGIGITGMINLGNQIDLCESDFLEFFAADPNTKAIAMYLEGPRDGRHFLKTLKKVAQIKPVVIIKPGRTEAGTKAAESHTASIGGNDQIFTYAIRQAGAIRKYRMDDFFDAAKALATQPLPKGKRVLMFTTSGGIGSIVADVLNENGAVLNPLPDHVVKDFEEKITMNGLIIANPYDIPALTPEEYHDSLLLMLDWDQKENLTDLFFFNMADGCPGIEQEILEFSKKTPKPIIVSYQGGGEAEKDGIKFLNENHIPAYPVATRAAKSAVTLIEYSNIWKKRGINKD